MEPVRLFIAVPLGPSVAESVATYSQAILAGRAGWKPIPPGLLHFTLRFLGSTDPARLEAVAAAMTAAIAGQTAFDLELSGLGCFPSPHHPQVLWLGAPQGQPLIDLAASINKACDVLGFEPETRPFVPHLTIGRLKRNARSPKLPLDSAERWTTRVSEVVLFRSELSERGPTYHRVAGANLNTE